MSFAVIISGNMKITVLWDVKPNRLVDAYNCSEQFAASMIHTDKQLSKYILTMEAAVLLERQVDIYHTTWHHISDTLIFPTVIMYILITQSYTTLKYKF